MPQQYNQMPQRAPVGAGGMDMRQVQQQQQGGQSRTVQPGGGQRVRSPQTSPVKPSPNAGQPYQQRSISPVQPSYQPHSPYGNRPLQQPNQYPPSRPNLQVNVTAPANPFVDPPRAAFAAPPSPTLSSTDTLVASPKNLLHSPSSRTLNGSTVSKTDPDNDRLAPARLEGEGQDFWKRFSMVAHEAEMEKRVHPETSGSDPWLSKEFRGSRKFKYSVWAIGLVCIAAIAGGLAWHFTHNDSSNKLSAPTQHDFGLGGTSSVVRSGFNAGQGGGSGTAVQAALATSAVVIPARVTSSPIADADTNIASADDLEDPATETELEPALTTSTRRAITSAAVTTATSTRVRATSTSTSAAARSTLAKRMHRHHRRSS